VLVKTEQERLLKAGFIRPVKIIDWWSLMILMRKINGKLRVCVDYRKLNACAQKRSFFLVFDFAVAKGSGRTCLLYIDGRLREVQPYFHSIK
jgi:hypothetical protein